MHVFIIIVAIVAVLVVVAALVYTRGQYAENAKLVNQYKTGGEHTAVAEPRATTTTQTP